MKIRLKISLMVAVIMVVMVTVIVGISSTRMESAMQNLAIAKSQEMTYEIAREAETILQTSDDPQQDLIIANSISVCTDGVSNVTNSADELKNAVASVSCESDKNLDVVSELDSEIDRFKLDESYEEKHHMVNHQIIDESDVMNKYVDN